MAPMTPPETVSTPPISVIARPSTDKRDAEVVGKYAAFQKGVERAGERRKAAGDHKARPLQRLRARGRWRRRAPRCRAARAGRSRTARTAARASAAALSVATASVNQKKCDGLAAQGARPDAEQAIVAAGDRRPLKRDRPDELARRRASASPNRRRGCAPQNQPNSQARRPVRAPTPQKSAGTIASPSPFSASAAP